MIHFFFFLFPFSCLHVLFHERVLKEEYRIIIFIKKELDNFCFDYFKFVTKFVNFNLGIFSSRDKFSRIEIRSSNKKNWWKKLKQKLSNVLFISCCTQINSHSIKILSLFFFLLQFIYCFVFFFVLFSHRVVYISLILRNE